MTLPTLRLIFLLHCLPAIKIDTSYIHTENIKCTTCFDTKYVSSQQIDCIYVMLNRTEEWFKVYEHFRDEADVKIRESQTEIDNTNASLRTINESLLNIANDVEEVSLNVAGTRINISQINATVKDFKNTIEANITSLDKALNVLFENKINGEKERIQDEIKTIEANFEREVKTLKTDVNDNIERLLEENNERNNIMKKDVDRLLERIVTLSDGFSRKIAQLERQIDAQLLALDKTATEAIQSLKKQLDDIFADVNSQIQSIQVGLSKRITEETESLIKLTKELNRTLIDQKKRVDIIYPNTFNKEMFIAAYLILVSLVMINFAFVFCLVKNVSQTSPARLNMSVGGRRNHDTDQRNIPHSPAEVVNRLPSLSMPLHDIPLTLENSITVISFYEDAQERHKRLLESLGECLFGHEVDYHVIRRRADIPNIRCSKLCFMFVQFSERHVIIEEPGLGLGDLKRKTYEAVYEMGACLVIVYVQDPGSRRMAEEDLFNENIYCVKSQRELRVLYEDDRFFSVYDHFNEVQKSRLLELIERNLS